MTGAKGNILEAIGRTPIVKLQKVARHVAAEIYVKCEYLNPGGSMKDRVALQHRRGRRAARAARAGRHDRRGDQRQHRHGPGAGRGAARLRLHLRDARQDVAGEGRAACARSARRSSSARPPSSPRTRAATTRPRSGSCTRRRARSTRTSTTTPPTRRRTTCRRRPRSGSRPAGEVDVFVRRAWARAAR